MYLVYKTFQVRNLSNFLVVFWKIDDFINTFWHYLVFILTIELINFVLVSWLNQFQSISSYSFIYELMFFGVEYYDVAAWFNWCQHQYLVSFRAWIGNFSISQDYYLSIILFPFRHFQKMLKSMRMKVARSFTICLVHILHQNRLHGNLSMNFNLRGPLPKFLQHPKNFWNSSQKKWKLFAFLSALQTMITYPLPKLTWTRLWNWVWKIWKWAN